MIINSRFGQHYSIEFNGHRVSLHYYGILICRIRNGAIEYDYCYTWQQELESLETLILYYMTYRERT